MAQKRLILYFPLFLINNVIILTVAGKHDCLRIGDRAAVQVVVVHVLHREVLVLADARVEEARQLRLS